MNLIERASYKKVMGMENLSQRVINEVNAKPPIDITIEDGEFYTQRLIDMTKLRQSIDSGNFPLEMYSSGEVTKRWRNAAGEVTREEYAEMPIMPPLRGRERGLRKGLLNSISGVRDILHEIGLGEVADNILIFDSTMPGGNVELHKKDEECEGK